MKTRNKDTTFLMGRGAVAVGLTSILGLGTYRLQELKTPGKIGRIPTDKETNKNAPTVTIYFTSEEGISREIARLQRLRRMMRKTRDFPVEIVQDPGTKCGAI